MAVASWHVYVDWDGSSDPTDAARKDIAASPFKVKQITINRGKSVDFSRYVAGQAEVVVSNPYGYFDSESPGIVEADGSVGGIRTTLANNQPVVDADRFFATPTAAGQAYAQSFQNAAARLVDRIDLRMKRTGAPGGTVTLTLYTNSAGVPGAKRDNYSTSRAVAISSISTSYEWVMFTFERPVNLLASTTYHAVVTTSSYTRAAGTAELAWGYNTTSYTGGAPTTYDGTTWTALTATEDFKFRVTANDVQVGRRCWIMAEYSGTEYPRFYGKLKACIPKPGATEQEAYLLFEDLFAEFARKEITVGVTSNRIVADQSAGSAITDVLTDMGITSTNWSVGDEDEVIPYLFFQRTNGQQALESLTEMACGFHFIQPAPSGTWWKYVWRARHYEYTAASVETWDRSLYQDMGVEHRMEELDDQYNRVIAVANPRKQGAVQDVWQYGALPEVWSASESRNIRADFTDPCTSLTTPVAGVDYPTGWTVGVTFYGVHADLVVTAPASVSTLTELKIRGTPVQPQPQVSAVANDTDSQAMIAAMLGGDGVLLGPPIDNDYIQTYKSAHRAAATMLDRSKRKFPDLTVTRSNRLGYPSILERVVAEVVTITAGTIGVAGRTNIGVNGTYMIESLEETITDGGQYHFVTYRCRKLGIVSSVLWVLGTSALGTETVLAP